MGSETGLPRSRLLLLPPTALIWASSDALTRVISKAMHDHPCRHGARDRDMLKQPVLERAVHWAHPLLAVLQAPTPTAAFGR